MATSYPPFEEQGEVREGFLCPLCLKDLQSVYQLQAHYEHEHSSDDGDVKGHLKSLVQKAKKAKNKLLKRDGEERPESSGQDRYDYLYNGGIDPFLWEPQEIGTKRSHLDDFKKHRAARIDHYIIEVNKLIIRLEKLTAFDRTNTDAAKIRAIEKSIVSWVDDHDVPFCPDCGNKFNIRNRRHHCRLCGSIMCKKCMEFLTLPFASKMTSITKGVPSSVASPSQSPSSSVQGSRRGSISSLSSVSSVLEEKDDDRIRCCRHCMDTLLKHEQQMEEKDHIPEIVKYYEKLRQCMEKVDQKAPPYIKMAESLNAGETTYNLENANSLRMEVQKYYELIDALSKKILSLGINDEPKPHPKALQLQKMIRYSATLFVQEKLLGLMSLPTKEKYEELKKERMLEMEKKIKMEREAAMEAQRKRMEEKPKDPQHLASTANGDVGRTQRSAVIKTGGWLPSSSLPRNRENSDPLLQQIDNIRSFIQQAREANRIDEVNMLEENLHQLQDEYDQQQTQIAIELSKKLAEEEAMQQQQLQLLHEKEWEREQKKRISQHLRTRSLDFREIQPVQMGVSENYTADVDPNSYQKKVSPLSKTQSMRAFHHLPKQDQPSSLSPNTTEALHAMADEHGSKSQTSLNPFDENDASPNLDDDPSNPFLEEIMKEKTESVKHVLNGKKEYNPFEEDDKTSTSDVVTGGEASNPFEDPASISNQGAAKQVTSTNPFDSEEDDVEKDSEIEEELLLQQIDNIRAYIFDAKRSGRTDEVELLSENLRELQRTLQEQKRKVQ
ncbi:rabenosyn-5 [Polypterus senegalus]